MKPRIPLASLAFSAVLVLGACSSGSTQVSGVGDGDPTGPSAPTGATATGTTTGPTAATGPTANGAAGAFDGPVSIDVAAAVPAAGVAAFYSCDGVLSTWTYIFQADFGGGISFDVNTTVDMSSGSGTLVYGDEFDIAGATLGWQDTVKLKVTGTEAAPTMTSTSVSVELTGDIEGFPVDLFKGFPENEEFPIVAGSANC